MPGAPWHGTHVSRKWCAPACTARGVSKFAGTRTCVGSFAAAEALLPVAKAIPMTASA
jgi:hypothetical protein